MTMSPVSVSDIFHPRYFVGWPKYLTVYFSCNMAVKSAIMLLVGADRRKSSVVIQAMMLSSDFFCENAWVGIQ